MRKRQIIKIDEDKCNGCGQCISTCADGALALVYGKAKLVSEVYCDGLGACIGECPEGALTIIEREADEFDVEAADQHLKELSRETGPHPGPNPPAQRPRRSAPHLHHPGLACPSASAMRLERGEKTDPGTQDAIELKSELGHWPVKLQLLGPRAPFLKGADLILTADCVPFAFPDFHRQLLRGKAVAIGCPKLDDLEAHIERLAEILKHSEVNSLTVVHMEVPCCFGFLHAAKEALERSGANIPLRQVVISRHGDVIEQKETPQPRAAFNSR